ncbi:MULTISPECIES: DUF6901 family protein [unclassified Hahella]|uniref:DUF6901 family protein n=1 Tax=unclassified Hahella TaxID=2624107 RepID=UPI001C1EBF87|nr:MULTISPECIES: hypothetical protein [unclassified Hahella]MBU6950291.1 hypothetical protein [Hahella sp. HN01]MDG9666374.1 hypothetical protein [Hahella sp. CR1]
MEPIKIGYRFKLDKSRSENFEITLDENNVEVLDRNIKDFPEWTQLDCHKCPHCPLDSMYHPHCPAALSLVEVVQRCQDIMSYEQVDLEVAIGDKKISQHTSAQKGLSALIGLLMSTSGCPHLDFFRPMARLHLPMATEQDTVFRAAGMYLLAQYFRSAEGRDVDLTLRGLKTIYRNLHQLNLCISKRLRAASEADSSVNAVILLDLFSTVIPIIIEDNLEDIREWFDPYMSELFDRVLEQAGKEPD